ncbi:MAG: hypothetical protein HWN65_06400 [Candidatus Helarchaeota archaeon]|nr:hypothetical protein [Candidatus Helarchaeota archaeon]
MTLNDIFEAIKDNIKKYFIIFAGSLFALAIVSTLIYNLTGIENPVLWIIFPAVYFFMIIFISRTKLGLALIGIAFGGYYVGLAIAGSLKLEWHVIYTLIFLGIAAIIITQFAIHKIVIESLGEIEHRNLVFFYTGAVIIGTVIFGSVMYATPAALPLQNGGLIIPVLFVIVNTAVIGYLSKRFWASFFLNFSLVPFIAFCVWGLTNSEFNLEWVIWSVAHPKAGVIELLLLMGCIFGGLFGLLGKYKQYTKPPITLTTPIDAAYVYRDRLSIMMLLGKNAFMEYETRGDKVVFYNRMDVKMGFRPKHEIRLNIIDENEVEVYLEKFAEREKIGRFKNPNKLREQFQPKWNLLGYALKAQLAKLLRPILLIISGGVVAYFIISLIFTIAGLPAITWPVIIAAISAGLTVGLLILFYLYISKRMTKVLEDHPEFSIAYIGMFVGVFLAAWFVSYLIQGALIAVSTANLDTFILMLNTNLIYLMAVTAIVGISSIQVLGVQNFNTYFYHKDIKVFKDPEDEPVWLDDKAYWVFRYAYEFPGEFTVSSSQIYHEDIERMDVWVNAKTGIAEWLVGDYHWREIWTRIPKSKDLLIGVNFSVNFHTPVYYVLHKKEYQKYLEIKTVRQLLSYFWDKLKKAVRDFFSLLAFWTRKVYRPVEDELVVIRDPPKKEISDWTVDFFTDVPAPFRRACADYLANIPWNFLRYPYGVDNVENEQLLYREEEVTPPRWPEKVPPEEGKGIPAMESKRICPKCGYIYDAPRWNCEVCKTDVRKYSAYTLQAPRLKKVKGWFGTLFRRTAEEKAEKKRLAKLQEKEKLEKAKAKVEAEKQKRRAKEREEEEKAKYEEIKS